MPSPGREPRTPPFALWQRANGDSDEYRRLMIEHGHLVPRPCQCGCPFGEHTEHGCKPHGFHEFRRPDLAAPSTADPAGLDVAGLAELLHQTAPFNHNLGEGPLRAICDSVNSHEPRATRMLELLALRALPAPSDPEEGGRDDSARGDHELWPGEGD